MSAMNTNALRRVVITAPVMFPRTFLARWREEDTGKWNCVAVIAYGESDAREIVAEMLGHYDIRITQL